MTITTRTIAKGVPPRLREPKPTAKAAKNGTTGKSKTAKKRVASESESESEDSEPVKKKKARNKKQRYIDSDEEIEVVDVDAEPPEKEVEQEDAGGDNGDQEEVSKDPLVHMQTLTKP